MQLIFILITFGVVIFIPTLLIPILQCFGIHDIGSYGTIMSALAAVIFGAFQFLITKKYTNITAKMQTANDKLLEVNQEINELNQQNAEIEQKRLLMDLQPNIEFSLDERHLSLTNKSNYPVWFYAAITNTSGDELPEPSEHSTGRVQISQNKTVINFNVDFNRSTLSQTTSSVTLKLKIWLSNVLDEPYLLYVENKYQVRLNQNNDLEILGMYSLLTDIEKLEKFPWQ